MKNDGKPVLSQTKIHGCRGLMPISPLNNVTITKSNCFQYLFFSRLNVMHWPFYYENQVFSDQNSVQFFRVVLKLPSLQQLVSPQLVPVFYPKQSCDQWQQWEVLDTHLRDKAQLCLIPWIKLKPWLNLLSHKKSLTGEFIEFEDEQVMIFWHI